MFFAMEAQPLPKSFRRAELKGIDQKKLFPIAFQEADPLEKERTGKYAVKIIGEEVLLFEF